MIAAMGTTTTICVRKVAGQPLKAIDIPQEMADRFEIVAPVDSPRTVEPKAGGPRAD